MNAEHRLGFLDGLRAVAVLIVMWHHVWLVGLWTPAVQLGSSTLFNVEFIPRTGFIGVDLFFCISGFALSLPYARAAVLGTRAPSVGTFFWRRLVKIVPSYWLVVAALFAFSGVHFATLADALRALALDVFFILNTVTPDPFGQINGVLWSLSVEVQYYVVFPLVALVLRRKPELCAGTLIVLAFIYRSFVIHMPGAYVPTYQVPAFIDLFAAGMLSAFWYTRLSEVFARFAPGSPERRAVELVCGGLVVAAIWLGIALTLSLWDARMIDDWRDVWLVRGRTGFALGFILMCCGCAGAPGWMTAAIGNAPFRFLSVISYNLYLWHQFIAHKLAEHWKVDDTNRLAYTLVAFALSIALASAITYAFERPLLRYKQPPRLPFLSKPRTARA